MISDRPISATAIAGNATGEASGLGHVAISDASRYTLVVSAASRYTLTASDASRYTLAVSTIGDPHG